MLNSNYDVAIAGAGIVGAACAAECAAAGLSVVVLDAGIAAGGATAAGMGHIVVMDDSDAQFDLTRYSQELWQQEAAALPLDCEFDLSGTIWVAADDEEMTAVRRKEILYSSRGIKVEVLDQAALRNAEPNLREDLAGGLRVPSDAVLYPPCAAGFLLEKAMRIGERRGFRVLTGKRVVTLDEDGVKLSDGTCIAAGISVNATGSYSPELTPGIKVQPRKGHLLITDRYPGFLRHQLVELGYLKSAHSTTADSVAFNIQPRRTGQLLIGSSRQFGSADSRIDSAILARMLRRATEYMPKISSLSAIRTWTGLRAATPDKLPLIGPVPGSARRFLATGHEGLGITTSLGTAKLLVDQIMNRTPKISCEPYLPARFAMLN